MAILSRLLTQLDSLKRWGLVVSLVTSFQVCGYEVDSVMDRVQAAMVFDLSSYIYWSNDNKLSRLEVCLAGSSSTINALRRLNGRTSGGRKLTMQDVAQSAKTLPDSCHILVIDDPFKSLPDGWSSLGGSVLILSTHLQQDHFPGAMMGFYIQGNKLRLWFRSTATKGSQIKISSQILKIAKQIDGDKS